MITESPEERFSGHPVHIYPPTIPTGLPAGTVLVHNHARPARRQGSRGFRYWLAQPGARLERVCLWLGARIVRTLPGAEVGGNNSMRLIVFASGRSAMWCYGWSVITRMIRLHH